MKCLLITNGADDGEEFVRRCRQTRADLPVLVFCINMKKHQQWPKRIAGPKVQVTDSVEEMLAFVDRSFNF